MKKIIRDFIILLVVNYLGLLLFKYLSSLIEENEESQEDNNINITVRIDESDIQ